MPREMSKAATIKARAARKNPSVAEAIVWNYLRGRKTGFKFRREHPIGPYRLDFFCPEARLAIEMDGEQHDFERDASRDEYLANLGIYTHRIPNWRFFGLDEHPYLDEFNEIVRLCELRSG